MSTLNQINLIGNISNDIDVKEMPSGQKLARFSMATNYRFKKADGTYEDQPDFHRIVAWSNLAQLMQDYGKKGKKIFVDGRVQYRQYKDSDGNTRSITEIVASKIILLGDKGVEKKEENDIDIPF